ncbi:MAG TPA: hypothetical protein VFJ16_32485 [Longimicrobium sp.]|nr:hypothetical protein [Longimicrobium sp.]
MRRSMNVTIQGPVWPARSMRLLVLVAAAVLCACDARDPVAPHAVPHRQVADAVPPPVIVATGQVFTPPSSSGADASLALGKWTDLAVPESAWVMVRIQGGVLHTYNPACNDTPPNWTCAPGGPPFETGPFNTQGSGGVDLWLEHASGGGNWVYPRPVGASAQEAMEGVLLLPPGEAGTLKARRRVVAVRGYDPTAGTEVAKYFLIDRQTITVSTIASPIRITASEPDSSGTVTYTAEPLYGLEFRNQWSDGYLPPGNLFWRFYPGDSLGAKPDWSWPGWYMYACERQQVCRYKPTVQGRMQVEGYVETRFAAARGDYALLVAASDTGAGCPGCGERPLEPKMVESVRAAIDRVQCPLIRDVLLERLPYMVVFTEQPDQYDNQGPWKLMGTHVAGVIYIWEGMWKHDTQGNLMYDEHGNLILRNTDQFVKDVLVHEGAHAYWSYYQNYFAPGEGVHHSKWRETMAQCGYPGTTG